MGELNFERYDIKSPLLEAILLGRVSELERILKTNLKRDDPYPIISAWFSAGSGGFTRSILTYLALNHFKMTYYPNVSSCNADKLTKRQNSFWNNIPDHVLVDAQIELETIIHHSKKQLEPHADSDGNLTCFRTY